MDQDATSNQPQGQMFRVVMGAVIALSLAGSGAFLYLHAKYNEQQRRLYQRYISQNAWIAPAQDLLNQMEPTLKEWEAIDYSKMPDYKKVNAQQVHLQLLQNEWFRRPYSTSTETSTDADGMAMSLFDSVSNAIIEMNRLCYFRWNPRLRKDLVQQLATREIVRMANTTAKSFPAMYSKLHSEVEKKISALSDDELAKRALSEARIRQSFRDIRWSREGLEKIVARPKEIPPGLDLAYAEKLK